MKNIFIITAIVVSMLAISGCQRDAQVASHNLSKAADMFEINRRVVFYNGITGDYMLTVEGRCSIEDQSNQLEVTCKIGEGQFKKHFLGLSDNVTYFAEHLKPTDVSVYHHRVVFKPQSIVPEVDLNWDHKELKKNRH